MSTTSPATATDVSRLLGEVDPLMIDQVVSTGASLDEIGEALRETEDQLGFGEESHEASSPRVANVRAVLHELLVEDDDSEDIY